MSQRISSVAQCVFHPVAAGINIPITLTVYSKGDILFNSGASWGGLSAPNVITTHYLTATDTTIEWAEEVAWLQ